MGFVPYIKPGFDLAKVAAEVFEADPSVEGLILDKHGIFTFGDNAQESYERMIRHVAAAEDFIAKHGKPAPKAIALPRRLADAGVTSPRRCAARSPIARGEGRFDRMISDFRTSPALIEFLGSPRLEDAGEDRRVSTPDLSIRIKTGPMVLPAPDADNLGAYASEIKQQVAAYVSDYTQYFETNNALDDVSRTMLDPMPQADAGARRRHVRPWPHAAGRENRFRYRRDVDRGGSRRRSDRNVPAAYHAELFALEYWSLEQAKLAANKPKPLDRPGGADHRRRRRHRRRHRETVRRQWRACRRSSTSTPPRRPRRQRAAGNNSIGVGCDITDPAAVASRLRQGGRSLWRPGHSGVECRRRLGGRDRRNRRRVAAEEFRAQFLRPPERRAECRAHLQAARHRRRVVVQCIEAGGQSRAEIRRLWLAQGGDACSCRGNTRWNMDAIGIRSNAVNADRIRSGLLSDDMIASRAKARGVTEKDYMSGNLLGLEVTAERCRAGVLASGARRAHHRRRDHGRRRQHRSGAAVGFGVRQVDRFKQR